VIQVTSAYLRLQASPEIFDFWCANETLHVSSTQGERTIAYTLTDDS
jgi:hypothetical protein